MKRAAFIKNLHEVDNWDVIIIGGGASGLGIAVDAATRGYSTLLLEQSDFAKGTSSRSTKLIHGGVRYLAQGTIRLVYRALHERGILLKNAPHLVRPQGFIIPCYNRLQKIKYLTGLKFYDWLAGKLSLGKSVFLDRKKVIDSLPNLQTENLIGGVQYYDAQFDDARLAINLAQTAAENGAVVLNHFKVTSLLKKNNRINGVEGFDLLTNKSYSLKAKLVINATGVFVDAILKLDSPGQKPLVRPSQGIHLVISSSFLKSDNAILIPETSDKRVLFIVPWHQRVLVGTTDTPVNNASTEPVALQKEIEFILETAKPYLIKAPRSEDVLSVFAGLRPLAATNKTNNTKEISRDHKLLISDSGLITITGGKWTTYRKMAEEVVDKAIAVGGLQKSASRTKYLKIHGYAGTSSGVSVYGSDEEKINLLTGENPDLDKLLSDQFGFREAHVVFSIREEMAMTVEDVLARRLRILFLDAKAAIVLAPKIADIMAGELGYDEHWKRSQISTFTELAQHYLINSK